MGLLMAALIPVNAESATMLPLIVCLISLRNTVRNCSFFSLFLASWEQQATSRMFAVCPQVAHEEHDTPFTGGASLLRTLLPTNSRTTVVGSLFRTQHSKTTLVQSHDGVGLHRTLANNVSEPKILSCQKVYEKDPNDGSREFATLRGGSLHSSTRLPRFRGSPA
jgi:hypothetical protein